MIRVLVFDKRGADNSDTYNHTTGSCGTYFTTLRIHCWCFDFRERLVVHCLALKWVHFSVHGCVDMVWAKSVQQLADGASIATTSRSILATGGVGAATVRVADAILYGQLSCAVWATTVMMGPSNTTINHMRTSIGSTKYKK